MKSGQINHINHINHIKNVGSCNFLLLPISYNDRVNLLEKTWFHPGSKNISSYKLLISSSNCKVSLDKSKNDIRKVYFDTINDSPREKLYIPTLNCIELGQAWSGNTINTVIFRHHGILTAKKYQFTAYYDHNKQLQIIKRDLRDQSITRHIIKEIYNLKDAHNSISLGIDAQGYLHLCYDHHVHSLHYRKSCQPFSIDAWTEALSMTGKNEERVTYPTFIIEPSSGSLLFMHRDGGPYRGRAFLKYYDVAQNTWTDYPEAILSGYNHKPWTSNPYWNHPVFDTEGKLHLSYVWRSRSLGDQEKINNIGIDYAYSPNLGNDWLTVQGIPLQTPITQVNSETIWGVPRGVNLINQTSMAVDSKGHPHIVFYANDHHQIPQYQHVWFNGKEWRHQIISRRTKRFDLLGGGTLQIPMSRPEVVIDKQDYIYVIYRADITGHQMSVLTLFPDDYSLDKGVERRLLEESLGFSEPVIDRLRWNRDEILSMLIGYSNQPKHDKNIQETQHPIYIVDWDIKL